MCGIVGYISTDQKEFKAEKAHFMRFALALDTLRGFDSTGVMTLTGKFKSHVHKTTMPGDRYVHSPAYKKRYTNGWASVGHNRAATVGNTTLQNAHPFEDGPITLVHNGTLFNMGKSMPLHNEELEVDSQQIAHNLAEHDPEQAKDVIEEIDGAYTLVWYDARDESINMVRNHERPMHFTTNAAKTIMWFMSDGGHLHAVNRSFQGRTSAVGSVVYKLDTNKLLKWKKGSLVPEVTEITPFVPTYGQWKPNQGHGSGSTPKKADGQDTQLKNATEKWQRQLESRTRDTGTGSPVPRVKLGGMVRRVPDACIESLKEEYDLDPSQLMEFRMHASMKCGKDNMVIGEVYYPEWQSWWTAIIRDVTTVQVNAYHKQNWLVQPVSIGPPWADKSSVPSIHCVLVHCDWAGYKKRDDELAEDEAEAEGKVLTKAEENEQRDTGLITGPDSVIIPFSRVKKQLDDGCVSCGCNLTIGELKNCMFVNNDQDILCEACVDELAQASRENGWVC